MFLGTHAIFQAFLLSFRVFYLFSFLLGNSIEDKDSTFISSEKFHLMVPVSFLVRNQI